MEKNIQPQTKKDKMANILYKIDAVKFGVFKLSSGKSSPYYIDLRVIPSFPDAFREICDFYAEYINKQIGTKNFNRIAGVPVAGIIFASQVAYNLQKPFLYVRKGIRLTGRERRVEGVLSSGDRVLLIDDLMTTGLTLKKTAEAVCCRTHRANRRAVPALARAACRQGLRQPAAHALNYPCP